VKPVTFQTTIEKLVYKGYGLGHYRGKVVFVPFSVPGDRLLVRPFEEKKTFVRAEIVRIMEPGNGRINPVCPHFGRCGGCHWQQLEYARQVEAKKNILEEIMHHRFPHMHELPIAMKASSHPFGYRSRARVQLKGTGKNASVGFFRHGSHQIEDIENCPLFRPPLNEALSSLRKYKQKVDTDGNPYEMDMACSEEENTWATARTEISTNNSITTLLGNRRGEEVIFRRTVGDFQYSVSASVFFQANDFMIAELVDLVRECVRDAGVDSALELFSGVGLFTLPLASQFARVAAVENSDAASRLCALNAKSYNFSNIEHVCSDVSTWLSSPDADLQGPFDLILLDPPRAGASPGIMEKIVKLAPETILYVSCDPQTLSRDLTRISSHHYAIERVSALDMFPQTYHFETVVLLRKVSRRSAVGSRQ
jgi:23S rRNA (uracil1939-C5)-methyltransferase